MDFLDWQFRPASEWFSGNVHNGVVVCSVSYFRLCMMPQALRRRASLVFQIFIGLLLSYSKNH
jgi:hypothetical protein